MAQATGQPGSDSHVLENRARAAIHRSTVGYFGLQAMAGALWWVLLIAWPDSRWWFFPAEAGRMAWAFALPDVALFVIGSVAAAWAISMGHRWATPLTWIVCGATWYATLLCWAASVITDGGWLGTALMSAASVLATIAAALAFAARWPAGLFRTARPRSRGGHLLHTLLQTVLFWSLFLFIVPACLQRLGADAGVPTFTPQLSLQVAATVLFVLASAMGMWSGVTMARLGEGTPLPTNQSNRLVTTGPYRRLRNPMAVAGIAQGVAVGLWLGSPLVLTYVFTGAVLWHVMVRPLEEHDLERRFGAKYEQYRQRVRCWWPVRRASAVTTG